jgi:hypothetical protein
MNSVRRGAAWIYRILIALFAVAVVVEIFLAGLGIFRAMPGEDESVSHETIDDKFKAHAGLGDFLAGTAPRQCLATSARSVDGGEASTLRRRRRWCRLRGDRCTNGFLVAARGYLDRG